MVRWIATANTRRSDRGAEADGRAQGLRPAVIAGCAASLQRFSGSASTCTSTQDLLIGAQSTGRPTTVSRCWSADSPDCDEVVAGRRPAAPAQAGHRRRHHRSGGRRGRRPRCDRPHRPPRSSGGRRGHRRRRSTTCSRSARSPSSTASEPVPRGADGRAAARRARPIDLEERFIVPSKGGPVPLSAVASTSRSRRHCVVNHFRASLPAGTISYSLRARQPIGRRRPGSAQPSRRWGCRRGAIGIRRRRAVFLRPDRTSRC